MSEEAAPEQWGTPEGREMIRLLWDPPTPSARGPKQKITLDQIVEAGMAISADEGWEGLSMRKLAQHLGVGVMSLYTYVPGKDQLFELMVDRAYGTRKLPDQSLPWREQVELHAHEARVMYARFPWMLHANLWRTPLGPHVMDQQEDLYRAVLASGLNKADTVRVTGAIEAHVFGVARGEITDAREASRTGITADEYWESRSSFWGTYYSPERFPVMTAIWESGAYDEPPVEGVEFGLARLLDGVELLIERGGSKKP
ncbi:MAG: TetR/AcrR family transcriptional regulator [Actinomycetota bacterium]|nr:TetR/AcrR family transcriptional regulator [Actinomycetota bacterium]